LSSCFARGLREVGYIEGKNIAIEYRYAQGKTERLAELAAELVRLKVDCIITAGTTNRSCPASDQGDSHCYGSQR